jgi:hypothetical protein
MAYSDYGGYAYKNGERVTDRSDCILSPEGIKSTPGMWPGWILQEGRSGGSHHALMGDGPIFISLYKQSCLRVYRMGEEIDLIPLCKPEWITSWKDEKGETHQWLNTDHFKASEEPLALEIDGNKITVFFRDEDNHYQYAEMIQPDGSVWHGFSGYGVGAGLEEAGYGFSTQEREDQLFSLFQRRSATQPFPVKQNAENSQP